MVTNFRIALAVTVLAVAPAALADEPTISASQPVYDAAPAAASGTAAPAGAVLTQEAQATTPPAADAAGQTREWQPAQPIPGERK